jgi:hypothetical protein
MREILVLGLCFLASCGGATASDDGSDTAVADSAHVGVKGGTDTNDLVTMLRRVGVPEGPAVPPKPNVTVLHVNKISCDHFDAMGNDGLLFDVFICTYTLPVGDPIIKDSRQDPVVFDDAMTLQGIIFRAFKGLSIGFSGDASDVSCTITHRTNGTEKRSCQIAK